MKDFGGAFLAVVALVFSASFGVSAPGMVAAQAPRPSPAASTPCGYLVFTPVGQPRYVEGTARETIKATVSFLDGHRESEVFPYPWVYPNAEMSDPWSTTNLRHPGVAFTLQSPPAGADVRRYPPLIRYILEHTGDDGYANLPECGPTSPPATAVPTSLADVVREVNAMRAKAERTGPMWLTFVDVTPRDSPIEIVDATMYTMDRAFDDSFVRECVTFRNRSPKTVTAIRFAFTYLDAAGKVKRVEPFLRLGSFAPAVVVEGVRRGKPFKATDDPEPQKNCRDFDWTGDPAENRIAVTAVQFADGATWPARIPFPWPALQR